MIQLWLPFPPSTNRLWRTVKGRVLVSEDYRKWKALAAQEIALQRPGKVEGPFSIVVTLYRPDKRRRDLDNVGTKAILDSLTTAGVIEDDRFAQSILLRWGVQPVLDPGAHIQIEAAE